MRKTLPALSHLQFIVLAVVRVRKFATGQGIRDYLKDADVKMSLPAFYQLMGRMEGAKLLSGRYQKDGDGKRERAYQITAAGLKAFRESVQFYREFDI